jgi:hypothetical protein
VGIVEATLGVAGQLRAELVCDVRQRALEVGRELSRIPAGCTAGHTIALDEDHAAVARAQDEERRGNPGNPRTHDGDISRRVRMKRLRWPVRGELSDPRRLVRMIDVRRSPHARS